MPTAILSAGCTICNDLLMVQAISSTVQPSISIEFVTNSLYWFLITFDFGPVPFIPDFQFTVRINPRHALYFNPEDMTQMESKVYNQTMLKAPQPSKSILQTASPPLIGYETSDQPFSNTLTRSQLSYIFG